MKSLISIILLFAALAGCTDKFTQEQRESAKEVEGLIHRSGAIIVYSLDPQPSGAVAQDHFHGYKILGQKEVTDPRDRRDLLSKLAESIWQNTGEVVGCFNPRHGLRFEATDGQMDFVICFECSSARGYGTTHDHFLLTGSGSAKFDTFLDKHKIQRSTE